MLSGALVIRCFYGNWTLFSSFHLLGESCRPGIFHFRMKVEVVFLGLDSGWIILCSECKWLGGLHCFDEIFTIDRDYEAINCDYE